MTKIILKKQNWFFEGKEEQEDVMLVLHRHWLTLGVQISAVILLGFLPFVLLLVLSSVIVKFNLIPIFSFFWVIYYMGLWYWLFYVVTMYQLDNWIVTNRRIVDSLQSGFFNRRIAELHLEKIQDVSYKVEGLIPTFFNYGTVEIQTAGTEHKFFFDQIPNPQGVKDVIMELIIVEEKKEEEIPNPPHHPHHNHIENSSVEIIEEAPDTNTDPDTVPNTEQKTAQEQTPESRGNF